MNITNTSLILAAFGHQGGTIHQAAKETGLTTSQVVVIEDIYYNLEDNGEINNGFSAISTCSLDWLKEKVWPEYKGNFKFWTNVLYAMRRGHIEDQFVKTLVNNQVERNEEMDLQAKIDGN